jgi:NarL family two-component system response regulator LiaR
MTALLIDDHPVTTAGLAAYLVETGRFTDTACVKTLAEAKQYIETASENFSHEDLSLVILDIQLGAENGLDFLPFLETHCREKKLAKPPVLVCSVLEEPFRIQNALKLGAAGFVPKAGNKDDLLEAIETVLKGELYLPAGHAEKVGAFSGTYAQLTKREIDVLNLVKFNKTNQEIAETLGVNLRTVENHISNIYFKTNCADRQDLMRL